MPRTLEDGHLYEVCTMHTLLPEHCVHCGRAIGEHSTMDLDQYQHEAGKTSIYPGKGSAQGLIYTVLGLAGEGGEVANTLKKMIRDDNNVMTPEREEKLKGELGDALWYIAMAAEELGFSLGHVASSNLRKLASRQERGVIQGDGGER